VKKAITKLRVPSEATLKLLKKAVSVQHCAGWRAQGCIRSFLRPYRCSCRLLGSSSTQ
jgi:hypothetical protein